MALNLDPSVDSHALMMSAQLVGTIRAGCLRGVCRVHRRSTVRARQLETRWRCATSPDRRRARGDPCGDSEPRERGPRRDRLRRRRGARAGGGRDERHRVGNRVPGLHECRLVHDGLSRRRSAAQPSRRRCHGQGVRRRGRPRRHRGQRRGRHVHPARRGCLLGDLRVEFSGWGDGYEPAFAAQGAPPATTQGDNNTSVQFVTLGAGGAATGVDFGLVIPDQVIQPDAPIATVIQYAGDPSYTGADSTADRADARRAAVVEGRQRRRRPATSPSAPNSPTSARSAQRGGSRTTG